MPPSETSQVGHLFFCPHRSANNAGFHLTTCWTCFNAKIETANFMSHITFGTFIQFINHIHLTFRSLSFLPFAAPVVLIRMGVLYLVPHNSETESMQTSPFKMKFEVLSTSAHFTNDACILASYKCRSHNAWGHFLDAHVNWKHQMSKGAAHPFALMSGNNSYVWTQPSSRKLNW
jgi:hypothetical protein